MTNGSLNGARVLVVEDEVLISLMLSDMLEQLGCVVLGPVATIPEAQPIVDAGTFDIGVLDVHVDGCEIYDLADRVVAHGIPLVIASGSGSDALPDRFKTATLLPKPYGLPALESALYAARAKTAA